ncbi:MAG: lysoplasmalogenase [Candidatus Hydrogenedentes bacterium]|nr:lysoplasmalogenase [Candidatus Hydrogenedentota bacterium]
MSMGAGDEAGRRRWNSSVPLWALAAVMGMAVAGMLVSRAAGWPKSMTVTSTVVASTAFLAAALAAGAFRSRYGILVLGALVCCWLGDIIGPGNFMWGLYAFLGGHLLFVLAFVSTKLHWRDSAYAVVALAVIDVLLMLWFLPNVPENERANVVAYTVVISSMVAAGWGARHANPWILPAAVIFFISDIFVARWRYGGGWIKGYLCYPLYYTACMLFAVSVRSALPGAGRRVER